MLSQNLREPYQINKLVCFNCWQFIKTYLEAAKTRFTKNYKALNPNKITSTVGLNIGVINTDGCSLNFWDLGGQEELQSLWDKVKTSYTF